MFRAERLPKSVGTLSTRISARSGMFASGSPLTPSAVTVTTLCDAPSWTIASGVTVTLMDLPNSEGPANGGASSLFIVHAAGKTTSRTATARLKERCMMLIYESVRAMPTVYVFGDEVPEVDRGPGHGLTSRGRSDRGRRT